jgi:CDP-glucose 4,6-dehydratase
MENMEMRSLVVDTPFWHGKKVFLTGHTGFKGSWLSLWLNSMGAEVTGYALSPDTSPNLFTVLKIDEVIRNSCIADIRDLNKLQSAMTMANPDIVIHMAAQPLVRYSYQHPVDTYATNVMGTVHVLESARALGSIKATVIVTTDKCYENREWLWPYRENEAMGGFDPYSSSKACSELVTAAYRHSFLDSAGIFLASARAGNVIGGGDWAMDRLVPDFLRTLDSGQTLFIRSPMATRPWQHVLEPLSGYLVLAEKLFNEGAAFAEAWNFGPEEADTKSVQWVIEYLCSHVSGATWQHDLAAQPHEANMLKLDSSKAKALLRWRPRWNLQTALDRTLLWQGGWKQGLDMASVSVQQIQQYEVAAGPA